MTGARIAGTLETKFMIPATRAVLPGAGMRPGIDRPIGAEAASPQSAIEIQKIATRELGRVRGRRPGSHTLP